MAAPIALLDVNVLIALLDPQHVHHEPAHRWFQANASHGWASCPLTQNALLRILSNPRYPNSPYLLALAVHQGGCLVSFDARLSTLAVPGGGDALCLIDPMESDRASVAIPSE